MKMHLAPGLGALLYFLILTSCSSHHNDTEETMKFINSSLASSIKFAEIQSENTYMMFKEKVANPRTMYKANLWEPKALAIQRQANMISNFLKAFKKGSKEDGDLLWNKIQGFNDSLLTIDSNINLVFAKHIRSFPKFYDTSATSEIFIKENLAKLSPVAAEVFLNHLYVQVRMLENRLVNYCLEQCPLNYCGFDQYAAIISQSSSVIGPGEKIKITAGIGAFSSNRNPIIIIGGNIVALTEDGAAYHLFKAPAKIGKYSVPIKIEFTNVIGDREIFQKIVEYSVVKK